MKKILFISMILLSVACNTCAFGDIASSQKRLAELESNGIQNTSNPKIRELYEKVKTQLDEFSNIESEYLDALQENATAMRDKEQSTENKLLGAAGIGATGIGGMQMASAMAESNADTDAEQAMRAYLATFTCNYGGGKNFTGGTQNIELPAANMGTLKSEYMALASDLKQRKVALELPFGLESETILDSSTTGLYDDESVGKTDGAFTSLAHAIMNPTGEDATEWETQKSETADNLKTGATVAGIGAIGSAVANLVINKDAAQENSEKIKNDFESKKRKMESEISDTETQLTTAISDNKKRIDEYNALLAQHQNFAHTITESECIEQFQEYIAYINSLTPISDDFADTSDLAIPYDLAKQQTDYNQCVESANLQRRIADCESQPNHKWINDECVNQPAPPPTTPATASIDNPINEDGTTTTDDKDEELANEPERCPAVNPRLRSITDKDFVGGFCSYDNVTVGEIYKRLDGTCSCTAKSCKPGYNVQKGRCVEIVADKDGYCLTFKESTNNIIESGMFSEKELSLMSSSVAPTAMFSTGGRPQISGTHDNMFSLCTAYCTKKANEKQCKLKQYDSKSNSGGSFQTTPDTHVEINNEYCICNPTTGDIQAEMQRQEKYNKIAQQNAQKKRDERTKNAKYYHVCMETTGAPANRRRCITSFDDINVQLLQGIELAKLWATEQYNDELVCSGKVDWKHNNDDFTNCMSITSDDPYYYTFRFDDLVESWDGTIEQSVKRTLCEKIYRGTFTGNYCSNMDSSKADKLVKNAPSFSINATKIKDTQVKMETMDLKDYTTQKINGIDPFEFYNEDIQLQANTSIHSILNAYIAMNVPYIITKFTCNKNPFQVSSKIDGRSTQGTTDDVLTCYVNGTPVDFVFDDLSENWDTYSTGGYSNMGCKAAGGEYDGQSCMYVNESTCAQIRERAKASMSQDMLPYWNASAQTCELPSAAAAQQLRQNVDTGIMVGAIAVTVVATVATAGTAGAIVLGTIEVAGGVVELASETAIDNAVDEFLRESKKCQNASCAESMLKTNLQRMANFSNDISGAKYNGVDAELARLAEMIPTNSDFYTQLINNGGASLAANNKGLSSWETEEIWRAVGITMGLASLLTSIVSAGAKYLSKTTAVIRRGASAANNASDAANAASDAANAASDAGRATNNASDAANAASDADRAANNASDAANAGRTANNTDTADNISDATHATTSGARTLTKAEKIEQARRTGNLGYHGTDADIAMDDMIRSSANSSDNLGSVGYGIAQDYSAAEKYAVKRLIERQNVGKNISFYMDANGNLVVQSTEPLNLSNKTGYVYTTAKRADMTWDTLNNGYVGPFKAAQMPESVEILEKTAVDLDDLIRRGKVKIDTPAPPTGATRAGANIADNIPLSGTALRTKASANFEQYLTDFKSTGANHGLPKNRMTDAEWARLNTELAGDNIRMVEYTDPKGNKYMKFERISNNSENINSATHAATNAATDGARTANATADASRAASASDNLDNATYTSSLTQRADFIRMVDKNETLEGLSKFAKSKKPLSDGGLDAPLTELVNGEIAHQFADDIHYLDIYSSSAQKWSTNTSKGLWTSIIFPDIKDYKKIFNQIIETALKHEKASIPIGHSGYPGHVFALIKNGDQWAIIDQFGRNLYLTEKNIIKQTLGAHGVKSQNIKETISTLTGDGQNRLDCFAYSSQVSFENLVSNQSVSHRLSNPFKSKETDEYIELMQLAARNLSERL